MSDLNFQRVTFTDRMEHVISTVFGLMLLPFIFLFAPKFAKRMMSEGNKIWLSSVTHRHRLVYDANVQSEEQTAMHEVQTQVDALVQQKDWIKLAEHLEKWDQSRAAGPTGHRFIHCALSQLQLSLSDGRHAYMADDCAPQETASVSDDVLNGLETAAAMHAKHYSLKAICAQLRMDQGWDIRGGGYVDSVPEKAWAAMETAFERADWLLADMDAAALNSPLVAMVKYRRVAGMSDADKHISRLYEDWSELDQGDTTPHNEYGFHMLPRWFGSYQELEIEAQKAVTRTNAATGKAAYTAMYFTALEYDPYALMMMDADLFKEGLDDLMRLRGNDPARTASLIQVIYTASQDVPSFADDPELTAEVKGNAQALEEMSFDLIRNHLTGLHRGSWHDGIQAALDLISEACQDDLAAGANLTLNQDGLIAHFPEGAGAD